ncbi:SDR family NAD(P)-dependent oxidoreductase [Streptomyces sp. NPDC008238]
MTKRRQTRTVVVTGASGGVGRAVARAFAARGDRVALPARGRTGLAAAADDVVRAGGEVARTGFRSQPPRRAIRRPR